MEKLKKTKNLVLKLLREDINTTKNYEYLIERVYETILPGSTDKSGKAINLLIREGVLPPARTIERAYRDCVRQYPELKDEITELRRAEQEIKYETVFAGWRIWIYGNK